MNTDKRFNLHLGSCARNSSPLRQGKFVFCGVESLSCHLMNNEFAFVNIIYNTMDDADILYIIAKAQLQVDDLMHYL